MNNRLSVLIALFAGLAGGLLTRYIAPTAVFAQAPAAPASVTEEIRARSFTLVDQSGRVIGTFTTEPMAGGRRQGPGRIVLRDPNGYVIWSAGGGAIRPLSASIR
jgi:hypothetical protein